MTTRVLVNSARFRRLGGLVFGVAAQTLFVLTVGRLYWFLSSSPRAGASTFAALARDTALALFFAVPHSILRFPRVQRWIGRCIGREFYGVLYCSITCVSLWSVFWNWRPAGPPLWELSGAPRAFVIAAFHAGWIALAYSMWLTGFGYQTGFTEWNHWRRREPAPARRFVPRGVYHWLRHPIYLSFLALVWLTPCMTPDRAVLAIVWTAYIAVGSYLKDERLAFYAGAEYRRYQERVTGYPLVFWGPLGRRRISGDEGPVTANVATQPDGQSSSRTSAATMQAA